MKLFCLALLCVPICLLADNGLPNQPYIYIEETTQVDKPADMVTLRFDVVGHDPDQGAANKDVQAKAARIFALLDAAKIPQNDVVASDLKSEAEYEATDDPSRKRGRLIGYSATRPFTVKVRDISIFAKLVNELLAAGSLEFSGIDPGLSNQKEFEEGIWSKALTNARQRAEKILKTAGMKIDSTFAISPVTFPNIQGNIFGSSSPSLELNRDLITKNVDAAQYRLPPISVSQTIHVIYLTSPAK